MASKKKTAAYRLFHYRYSMLIPQMYMVGPEYARKVGYHISGDGQLDQARLHEPAIYRQTPAGLAVLHEEGAPLEDVFVNPRDAVPVYDDIQEHLTDWLRAVREGIHLDDVPDLNEFRAFEAIALFIYKTAKFYDPEEVKEDKLRNRLIAMNRTRNPRGTTAYLRSRNVDEKGQLKPYVSIVDRIEEHIIKGGTWQ